MSINIAIVISTPSIMLTNHLPILILKHFVPTPYHYYYWESNKESIYNDVK